MFEILCVFLSFSYICKVFDLFTQAMFFISFVTFKSNTLNILFTNKKVTSLYYINETYI